MPALGKGGSQEALTMVPLPPPPPVAPPHPTLTAVKGPGHDLPLHALTQKPEGQPVESTWLRGLWLLWWEENKQEGHSGWSRGR